jgi:acetyl-CoA carboxylase biotin carboxyl carrier protein
VAREPQPVIATVPPPAGPARSQRLEAGADEAPPAPAVARAAGHPGAVHAPMVGTVYLTPEPGAQPFVSVGDEVREGQTLLIIEAMKVMNPIRAPRNGRIVEIAVGNGDPVEYGELLMIIE